MPIPSPFHERTFKLCSSYQWMDWAGYLAVRRYDARHDGEYFALRYAAGLIDVSPLCKYEIKGRDLSRLMTRDLRRLEPGRAAYVC